MVYREREDSMTLPARCTMTRQLEGLMSIMFLETLQLQRHSFVAFELQI